MNLGETSRSYSLSTKYPVGKVRSNFIHIIHLILGSEDDDSDDGEENIFTPRDLRMYFDDDDQETPETQPVFAWPPQHQTRSDHSDLNEVEEALDPSLVHGNMSSPAQEDESEISNQLKPTDLFDFEWRSLPRPPIPPENRREIFTEQAGSTIEPLDPYEAFTSIWNSSIIQHIVDETNKYARQLLLQKLNTETLRDSSRITAWSDVNADEIFVFLAIVIAMSMVRKNVMTDYWSKDTNIFSTPHFAAAMSRNRFQLIFRCLHFNDNSRLSTSSSSAEAKIYKLEPITQHLNSKFSEIYSLDRNISLDESLTQWKGWLSIKQCIPNKAVKVGIKTYEVCESKTGYLYRFEIHAKSAEPQVAVSGSPISGFVPSLVLRLLEGLENKGFTVWMDNFYNSPALARVLKIRGFDCVGTLRTNRSLVPVHLNQLKSGQLPLRKGALIGCTSGDVDLFVWHDTKRCAFISTYHGMSVHHCNVENKSKPILVRDYNVSMGGVDKKDQIVSAYPIERKRLMVWYKKLFFRLLNVSVLNASIVLNNSRQMSGGPNMTQKTFRNSLVLSILERHKTAQRSVPQPIAVQPCTRVLPRNAVAHFTVSYDTRENTNERLRRTCTCRVVQKKSATHCPACNVALCMSPCAQQYHSE